MSERYNNLIIDVVNFAYKTFQDTSEEVPVFVGKKDIYKTSACNFINAVDSLKKKYLHSDGKVYLLFDNYFSRADMQSAFQFADRKRLDEAYKATRKKENKQFYQTLNFLRYYYMIGPSRYFTLRLDNLEADDLVKPLLSTIDSSERTLLVSSDLDWARYIGSSIHQLTSLKDEPKSFRELSTELGFEITENSLVMYKAIFGDPSDNIPALVHKTPENLADFVEISKEINYPEQLNLLFGNVDYRRKDPFLSTIASENGRDKIPKSRLYTINVQLISAIKCSPEIVKSNLVEGRDDETLFKSVKEAIGLETPKQNFVFGNIKRPRA